MIDMTAVCRCGEQIEDRSMPRMSGPQYPFWIHSDTNSGTCADGWVAAPDRTRTEERRAAQEYNRAIMTPPGDGNAAHIRKRLNDRNNAR